MIANPMLSRSHRVIFTLILVYIGLFLLMAYTFLHEAGHAIIGVLFGAKLTSFSAAFWDLSAHVGLVNDEHFSILQHALVSLAGIALPILVWLVVLMLLPRRGNVLLEWFKWMGTISSLAPLIVWIIFPILDMYGSAPGDDSTNFVRITSLPPLLVSAGALLVILGGLLVYFSRTGGISWLKQVFRSLPYEWLSIEMKKTLRNLLVAGFVLALISVSMNVIFKDGIDQLVPDGYALAAEIDLSVHDYELEPVYQFSGKSAEQIRLFFVLSNVSRAFEIGLLAPDGTRSNFLQGDEAFTAGQATVNPDVIHLEPGQYAVYLSARRNSGKVQVYTKAGP